MIKKLFSHSAVYGLAPQIPKIASIFTLPIITRYLTTKDFGIYGLITAVAGAFSVLSNLGLNVSLGNSFYKSPGQYKWVWRQIYGFLMLWNIPYSVLLSSLLYFFIPDEAKTNSTWIILLNVLPIVFFGPTSTIGTAYYQYMQKPLPIAIRSIIVGLLTVFLNLMFIAYLKIGYMGWFISLCISDMANNISYFIPLYKKIKIKPIFNFKRRLIKNLLKVSVPTIPHYYAYYILNTSDRIIMNFAKTPIGDIGKYNAANIPGNFVQSAGFAIGKALGPLLYQSYKKDNERLTRRLLFTIQITFLIGTFLLSVWLKDIFGFLIKNKELQSTYSIAVIIIMAYNYRPMYFGASYRLIYLEKTKILWRITLIAAILNLILNIIFLPIYGYIIAVYTTFLALMYMGYAGYFLADFKAHSKLNYFPFFWLILTILSTIAVAFISKGSYFIKIVSSAIYLSSGLLCLFYLNSMKMKAFFNRNLKRIKN